MRSKSKHNAPGSKGDIVLDSGATNHFFGDLSMLDEELIKVKECLYSAEENLEITEKGAVSIGTEFSTIVFNNVSFVQDSKTN